MYSHFKKIFSLIFIGFIFFLIVSPLHAQQNSEGINLTVSPAVIELVTEPGTKTKQIFRVRNNGLQPSFLTIHLDKLTVSQNGEQVIPVPPEPGDPSTSWITFSKNTFVAPPQEWVDIEYTVNIPKDAAFGYYYAIRISHAPPDIKGQTAAKLYGEIGLPILMEVKAPGAKKEAQLLEFKAKHYINEYLPVDFTTILSNTGNVHVLPKGDIFIRDSREKDIGTLDVNPNGGNILPGQKRTFENSWDDGFLVREPVMEDGVPKVDSHGQPITHLVMNWNKITSFRFGKYTANEILVYDNGTRDITLEASTTFWVIPYTIIAIIIITILVLFLIIRFLLKAYVRSQIKKYQKT